MSNYSAMVSWSIKDGESFLEGKYSRAHAWTFDGGLEIPASSAPQIVPIPFSDEANVDPEEAFIASLSSCHMLFFLYFAAKYKFSVSKYYDSATGTVGKNENGKMAVTSVTLKPQIEFEGEKKPNRDELDKIHHLAHDNCFIANSVTTKIHIEF